MIGCRQKHLGIWEESTVEELAARAGRCAAALAGAGVGSADGIAILARNCPEWAITQLAAESLGARLVPVTDASIVVVEGDEQLDDLTALGELPKVRHVARFEELAPATLEGPPVEVPSGGGHEVLSYLPMDHPAEQALSVHAGHVVHYGDGRQSLAADLREVQPTLFFAPAELWERFHKETEARIDDATRLKRTAYRRHVLVRRPLRRALGFARLQVSLTDRPVDDATSAWLSSLGIELEQFQP